MVALWIAAGTEMLGDGALGVRVLSPIAAALGSWLLAQAAFDLLAGRPADRRHAGLVAAALLNASLLFGVGAVTMTPDSPLLFFWTATIWALGRLHATGRGVWWLVAGATIGSAALSKYTAALLVPGILIWLLAVPSLRVWLRRPQPWLGAGIALVLFAPVLAWNQAHGWVSLLKQAGRAGDWSVLRAGQFLGELLGGQLGLATPIIAVLCAAGMVLAVRRGKAGDPGMTLLAGLSAVPALVFVQHALGERVQANWPGIIYPAAAIAAAALAGRWMRLVRPGIALGLGVTAIAWLQVAASPFALPMRLDPTLLRLGGWQYLAAEVAVAARAQGAAYVASDNYGHASLLARLLPADLPVIGIEGRWALFALPDARPVLAGRTGVLVRSARRDDAPDLRDWATLERLGELTRRRNGMTAEGFRLYRVVGRHGDEPAALLPRPR